MPWRCVVGESVPPCKLAGRQHGLEFIDRERPGNRVQNLVAEAIRVERQVAGARIRLVGIAIFGLRGAHFFLFVRLEVHNFLRGAYVSNPGAWAPNGRTDLACRRNLRPFRQGLRA